MAVDDIEKAVLGAVLIDNSTWLQVSKLFSDDFSLDSHRRIFSRMRDLADRDMPIEAVEMSNELDRHNELDLVGGPSYLGTLIDGAVPENVGHNISSLRDHAKRRRLSRGAEHMVRVAADRTVSTASLSQMAVGLSEIADDGPALPPRHSEDSLALRFSKQYADDLRYVARWSKWMRWDKRRWVEDDTLHVFDCARAICRGASAECGDSERTTGVRLASKNTSAAVERLAAADPRHAATVVQWDSDPWLLNTPTGTVDLRTGEIHEHLRNEYITKMTASGPGGDCPLWRRFLDRITNGDHELQSFLQRMIGYSLTGSTREHAIFFFYGTGANGKSVYLSTISGLLGEYAKTAPASSFTASATEQHPTDLAGLRGARFVTAVETEEGSRWAESKIKSLTGGDRISARLMRCDFFEFVPELKLVIAGNHKPSLRSVDEAIRRRLHLVPFTVTIAERERDPCLADKLKAEYPGILAWAIEGCLDWQRSGLDPPAVVRNATADYFASEDAIGRWLDDRCVTKGNPARAGEEYWAAASSLFTDWQAWCNQAGEREGSQKRFTQQLEARGFQRHRTSRAKGFVGIALRDNVMPDVPDSPISTVSLARVDVLNGRSGTSGTYLEKQ